MYGLRGSQLRFFTPLTLLSILTKPMQLEIHPVTIADYTKESLHARRKKTPHNPVG